MSGIDDLKQNIVDLIADISAENSVIDRAEVLLKGLTDQIAELQKELAVAIAAGDMTAIQAAADSIKAQNDLIISKTTELANSLPAVNK